MSNRREFKQRTFDTDGNLVSTGSANAYAVRGARPMTGYAAGLFVTFFPNFTNTGAATLAYGNLSAKSIKKGNGTALAANDILSGVAAQAIYDKTNDWWQLLNPQTLSTAFVLKTGDTMSGQLLIDGTAINFAPLLGRLDEDGAGFGPQIILDRNSASPAANDLISRLTFRGRDSGGNSTNYAYIVTRIDDATDGSEDATVLLGRLIAGVDTSMPIMAPPSPAQGDVAYFDGSQWVSLVAGASGQFLKTNGAGANPAWATAAGGITTIASGSLPAAATQSFTSIASTYAYLILHISGASSNTATRQPLIRVSTNNGTSYDATATNYVYTKFDITTPVAEAIGALASLIDSANDAAAGTWTITIYIYGYHGGPNMHWTARVKGTTIEYMLRGTYIGSTSAINALQILWNGSGNFDAGTYALYGVS